MKIVTEIPARDVLDEAPFKNEGLYNDINVKNWWNVFDMVMTIAFPDGCTREEAVRFFNDREDFIRERMEIVDRTSDPTGEKFLRAASLGRMTPDFG